MLKYYNTLEDWGSFWEEIELYSEFLLQNWDSEMSEIIVGHKEVDLIKNEFLLKKLWKSSKVLVWPFQKKNGTALGIYGGLEYFFETLVVEQLKEFKNLRILILNKIIFWIIGVLVFVLDVRYE